MNTQKELTKRDIENYSNWVIKYSNNPKFEIEYLIELILNNNDQKKQLFINTIKNNF